jgi:hypothetical protein
LSLQSSPVAKRAKPPAHAPRLTDGHRTLSRLEGACVELYAQGLKRRKIARLLLIYLAPPNGEGTNIRMRMACRKLRALEQRKWFRDAIWERALVAADLRTPAILAGLSRKAEEGKVDAAKLTLGITGRYSEEPQAHATQVNIVFGSDVPRPSTRAIASNPEALDDEELVEGEFEDVTDE